MKCEALIATIAKKGKARSIRPLGPNTKNLETCGGDVTFTAEIINGTCCRQEVCYCSGASLQITATCTRCQAAYFQDIDHLLAGGEGLFTRMLNERVFAVAKNVEVVEVEL
jgi:hypothetical protein